MIKFAVCDDEPLMAQEISNQLSQYMGRRETASYSVSCFSDARSLLKSRCDFDVIFLDIQMAELNGIETARLLRQRQNHSLLIFVTVLREYVFDAFEVEAYDYLIKPIDRERFQRTMDRAVQALEPKTAKEYYNPAVDILLSEKLELAKTEGIETDVTLLLPRPCGMDDFDLCVIFANALDNAIHECQSMEGARTVHIRWERQGDFYMQAFENTC